MKPSIPVTIQFVLHAEEIAKHVKEQPHTVLLAQVPINLSTVAIHANPRVLQTSLTPATPSVSSVIQTALLAQLLPQNAQAAPFNLGCRPISTRTTNATPPVLWDFSDSIIRQLMFAIAVMAIVMDACLVPQTASTVLQIAIKK